jgi:hypothetical protein
MVPSTKELQAEHGRKPVVSRGTQQGPERPGETMMAAQHDAQQVRDCMGRFSKLETTLATQIIIGGELTARVLYLPNTYLNGQTLICSQGGIQIP